MSVTPTLAQAHPDAWFIISQFTIAGYFDLNHVLPTGPGRTVLAGRALAGLAEGAGEFSLRQRGAEAEKDDRADAVGHSDDGQAEREGNAENVDGCRARAHSGDDSRAAAEQDQCECTDELRELFLHRTIPQ